MIEIIQQIINGVAIGGVYVLIALGLTTVFGILGIAHFAHGSVSMFGGYLTFFFVTAWGLPLIAAIMVSLVVGLVLGVLIELSTVAAALKEPPAEQAAQACCARTA